MTDDTELYGAAGGGSRDSYDRGFLQLMRKAREQALHLWRDDTVFCLNNNTGDTVFKTDKPGLEGLRAISAWLTANADA